jgi:carboxyl-terminal processing protease
LNPKLEEMAKNQIFTSPSKKHIIMKFPIRIIMLGLIFLIGTAAIYKNDNLFEISKNIEIFVKAYKELNSNYVDELDPSELMKIGIDAMVESLDPYTNYISEAQIESYRLSDDGTYKGIGAKLDEVDGKITIIEPFDGSPAAKAGLKAGDVIIEVNGLLTEGKTVEDMDRVVRGVPGTELSMKINRPLENVTKDVSILRSEVLRENVPYYGMVKDGVGYVILTTFTNESSKNIAAAIKEMKEENGPLNGIILDLRSNGGGLLREAIMVSNLFIEKGEEVVSTRGKEIEKDQSYRAMSTPLDLDVPLAILINKTSASASEIVSGVIQDLDRGILIGQKSYGKGLVQNTVDIAYNNRMKITISKYYIPSGRCIQSVEYNNGEPVDIADDLRSKFKTRNGRTVLDGGGVSPDIKMEPAKDSPLMKALKKNHMVFKYVNEYVLGMDSIENVNEFVYNQYHEFVAFLEKENFSYKTQSEDKLADLQKNIDEEFEGSGLNQMLVSLQESIKKEKAAALNSEKALIIKEIETEIVSRFFQQSGRVKFSLSKDPEVLKAVQVLNNTEEYNKLLGNS